MKKALCGLASSCVLLGIFGCGTSSLGSLPNSVPQSKVRGQLLLYLEGTTITRTPPPNTVGVTSWGLQLNGFDRTSYFLIYEKGYQGSFTLASSCPKTESATATAVFTPDAHGPGAVLAVTSGDAMNRTTCVFTMHDSFGQTAILSAGYPG